MNKSLMMCDLANSFFLPFSYIIYLFKNIDMKDKVIVLLIHIGIFIYIIGRYLKNTLYIEIYHYMLGFVYFLIPLFIVNKELLVWHISLVFFTISSRRIFNGCIVRHCESKNPISDNNFTKFFNWDILFPILGTISLIKLYYLY